MDTQKNSSVTTPKLVGSDFFDNLWEESWAHIKTVVDVAAEAVLILDKDLRVMVANKSFHATFQVESSDTEGKLIYELGSGQWNIAELRKLLEDVLPQKTFFKGFEITREFPVVGRKTMILNARQIHLKGDDGSELFPAIILLAMEDVTEMMAVAESLASHTNNLGVSLSERTKKLEIVIEKLEKEINELKNKK